MLRKDRDLVVLLSLLCEQNERLLTGWVPETERKILESRRRLIEELDCVRTLDPEAVDEETYRVRRVVTGFYGVLLTAMNDLCTAVGRPASDPILLDDGIPDLSDQGFLGDSAGNVFVLAGEDEILIRTPPLPHKKKLNKQESRLSPDSTVIALDVWCEAVRRALPALDIDLGRYERRTITILNAEHHSPNIMDNDNRETLRIVDAICTVLPGEDRPDTTRIVLDGIICDDLLPGALITIRPYDRALPEAEATVAFWREYLGELGFFTDIPFIPRLNAGSGTPRHRPTRGRYRPAKEKVGSAKKSRKKS